MVNAINTKNLNVYYGDQQAIHNISLDFLKNKVTALIGPSGCGKSTFLRCLNRMNDVIDICRVEGNISLNGMDIYSKEIEVEHLREKIGMVFQKPNPFPKSIYDNVAYGPRIHGFTDKKEEMDLIVETSLKKAGLFEEVKDRLEDMGTNLSGGQQQRVAIARTLASRPRLILADEPTGNLDEDTASNVMDMLLSLVTEAGAGLLMVTHSTALAARLDSRVHLRVGQIE